jgi:putative transposase
MPRRMPYRQGRGTAGVPFHVINRGARKLPLFEQPADYRAFEFCVLCALERVPVAILAYCLMPNHFHLVAEPLRDGDLSRFMKALLGTHSKRWHAFRGTTGVGAVYQGRFKAFPIQAETHFYSVCRYVERNALRARLVARAEDWPWSSLSQRCHKQGGIPLSEWPVAEPLDWVERVNADQPSAELEALRACAARGRPFGSPDWTTDAAAQMGLAHTLRRGRPKRRRVSFSWEKTPDVF